MRKNTVNSWFIVMLLTVVAAANAHADVVVIVNQKNPLANLTAAQVSAIYLGNTTKFPDGGPVALADLPESAAARSDFYQKTVGRSAAQAKATWARITFTGQASPPKELKSNADVKAFVAGDLKAMGYIDASAVDSSVKVVLKP